MLVRIEPLKSFIAARSLLSSIGTTTILTRRATQLGQQRLWLHAHQLAFVHPFSDQSVQIVSDWRNPSLNADWCQLQTNWPWIFDPRSALDPGLPHPVIADGLNPVA